MSAQHKSISQFVSQRELFVHTTCYNGQVHGSQSFRFDKIFSSNNTPFFGCLRWFKTVLEFSTICTFQNSVGNFFVNHEINFQAFETIIIPRKTYTSVMTKTETHILFESILSIKAAVFLSMQY